MVKHTQRIHWLLPAICLSVSDHFVGLALKELRIIKESLDIFTFKPHSAINLWFNLKMRRISAAKKHSYPKNRKTTSGASKPVGNVIYFLLDLDDSGR